VIKKSTCEIHCRNFRRDRRESRANVRIRYARDRHGTIIHDEPKDLVLATFIHFAYGHAALRADTFRGNLLELGDIETLVSLPEPDVLVPKPASTRVAAETFVVAA
jgi:hypothetical protein